MNPRLARALYSALMVLMQPLLLARLWWRGRREPLYRADIGQRLARYGSVPAPVQGWLWVHAVSLGETRAAQTLVAALRQRLPGTPLLLTCGTATGREAGRELLAPGDAQCWLPFDTSGGARRFIERFRPRVGVLMETEIWPNLLHVARDAGLPMVLANARLSEKSLRRGLRLDALMRPAAQSLALVLAQTDADAKRLRQAGGRDVQVCGNLKFDMAPDEALLVRGRTWRSAASRAVVLAAVTREGEESMLLDAWTGHPVPRPLLVIVPRHPQRFDEVAALVRGRALTLARRSEWIEDRMPPDALSAEVWLGDSMREMPAYYALADVALLGGSFAPLGGQNLIEAAACGCPVIMGPHTFNFSQAAELSLEARASIRVSDMREGVTRAIALASEEGRAPWEERALAFARAHRGATVRMADRIADRLRRPDAGELAARLSPS
jgi:3-deoxy-D-manno-octulosonic-acid transferase